MPFFSLLGILASTYRTVYQDSYVTEILILSSVLDVMIILLGFRYVMNSQIGLLLILLFFSTIVGLLSNPLSRRFITDFTNPLFFFSKVFVFRRYWLYTDFKKYTRFYTRIATIGSLALLPVTYFLFKSGGKNRLAIFPPMELPFANYMLTSSLLLLGSFIIILLYGKRAQLFSAIIVFFSYTFFFKRSEIVKYLLIFCAAALVMIYIFANFSDNLAVARLKTTFDLYKSEGAGNSNIDQISAGRYNEFETVISQMKLKDYFLGKGCGFVYNVDNVTEYTETSNAHFSPIGFLSKYGLAFTIFVYYFMFSIFFKSNKGLLSDSNYVIALGVSVFIFMESFFAYALFVTPILPVALGVLLAYQKKQKAMRAMMRRQARLDFQYQPQ